jgi:hypothetical protein
VSIDPRNAEFPAFSPAKKATWHPNWHHDDSKVADLMRAGVALRANEWARSQPIRLRGEGTLDGTMRQRHHCRGPVRRDIQEELKFIDPVAALYGTIARKRNAANITKCTRPWSTVVRPVPKVITPTRRVIASSTCSFRSKPSLSGSSTRMDMAARSQSQVQTGLQSICAGRIQGCQTFGKQD